MKQNIVRYWFCFIVIVIKTISTIQSIQNGDLELSNSAKQYLFDFSSEIERIHRITSGGNPYILACNSSGQCQDTVFGECSEVVQNDSTTWFCECLCDGYGFCQTNRDCCNNDCENGFCAKNGGTQGTVCTSGCSACASEFACKPWPYPWSSGYCDYKYENPYVLACNSSSQCQSTVLKECLKVVPNDPSTWYCNCWCSGFGPCKSNADCCNNNCRNGVCSDIGGLQGTVCSPTCSTCADKYICENWPSYSDSGYCDFQSETSSFQPTTGTISPAMINPWIAGCPNGNTDCNGTLTGLCYTTVPNDPSTWVCCGACDGLLCKVDKDCVNNDCVDGHCTFVSGTQGAFCWTNGHCGNCSVDYFCHEYPPGDGRGYCDHL